MEDNDSTSPDTATVDGTNGDGNGDGNPPAGLGDAGKRALAAEREARRRAEREATEARKALAAAQEAAKTDSTVDVAATVAEAVERVRAEVRQDMAAQVARANLVAEATGRLAHPDLAPRLIDPATIPVADDGTVDAAAVAAAIETLAEQYPALAQPAGRTGQPARPSGSADQGPRDASDSYAAQIQQAMQAGDLQAAIRLKNERAAAQSASA